MSRALQHPILTPAVAWLINLVRNTSNLLRTSASPYHLASSCPASGDGGDGGGGPAPCTCTYPTGLSSTYTVSGFTALVACPECDASSDPGWPGIMYHVGAACAWWAVDPSFDAYSVGGHSLEISYTQLRLNTAASPCRWELVISCGSVLNSSKIMWLGYKDTGTTPAGTYNFSSSDCGNSTPTMTVV